MTGDFEQEIVEAWRETTRTRGASSDFAERWRQTRRALAASPIPAGPGPHVLVVAGGKPLEWHSMRGERWVIGRAASCDLSLDDPWVSKQHCEMVRHGAYCLLRDLDSKNGVYVNGRKCEAALLKDADVVQLGDVLSLIFASGADEPT